MGDKCNNIILENVQVSPNGEITGKVKNADESEETEEYYRLFEQLNNHFDNDQMVSIINYNPRQNEVCACSFANTWHRVKVEYVLSRKNGPSASCVFVDDGREEQVPVSWLRQLPKKFLEVPFQVKRIFLHGIQPVTMTISEEVMAIQRPVKVWDEAAVKFIHDRIKAASRVKCVLMEQHSDTAISVRLYLENNSGGHSCLNEILVKQKYAVNLSDIQEDFSLVQTKPKKTIQEVIRSRQHKQMASLNYSDTEISAKSDTEFTVRSRQERVSVGKVEKGYETDTLGISAMSHRAIHRSPGTVSRASLFDPWEDENGSEGAQQRGSGLIRTNQCSTRLTGSRDTVYGNRSEQLSDDCIQVKRAGVTSRISPSEEDSVRKIETHRSNKTVYQYACDSDSSNFDTPTLPRHSSPLSSSHSQTQSSPFDKSSSVSPGYGRGGTGKDMSVWKSPVSPKLGACSQSLFNSGDRSPSYGRGALLAPKQCDFQYRSDSEIGKASIDTVPNQSEVYSESEIPVLHKSPILEVGMNKKNLDTGVRSPKYGRGALLSSLETPGVCRPKQYSLQRTSDSVTTEDYSNKFKQSPEILSESEMTPLQRSPRSQTVGKNNNASDIFDQKSPNYGRGVLLSSPEVPGVVRPKLSCYQRNWVNENTEVISNRLDQKHEILSEGEISSLHKSPHMLAPSTNKNASIVSDQKSPRYGRGAMLSCIDTPGITRPNQNSISQGTLTDLNDHYSAKREIYSESELIEARHASTRLKTKVNREELVKLGAFDDITETHVSSQNVNQNNVSSIRNSPVKTGLNMLRTTERRDYSSGCESSTSTASVVAASVFGQTEFKKSRLPKVALGNSNPGDPGMKQNGNGEKKSPSKMDLQKLMKQMAEKTTADRGERAREPESALSGSKKIEMMGKLTGQKILERLGSGSRPQNSYNSTLKGKEVVKGMIGAADRVVVHGTRPPKPFKSFNDTASHFTLNVKQHLEKCEFAAPTLVQAYTWPVIVRGRHVVTISPTDTGKTFAYLYPLLSGMSDARIYQELPAGNGPLTIIVTFSWRKAELVYDHTQHIVAGHGGLRVVLVHGGGEEDKKSCTLINGCEILVVTAPCLKRLLESGLTEVRRLCHLVIDDGDQVLQSFSKEVSYLVEEYTKVIGGEMKQLKCPRQILMLGSQWNKATEEFLIHFLCEPVLIITSSFEGSIYGRVKQVTHMCRPDDRMKEVLGILGNVVDGSHKTIVFATKKEDIINLFKVARNCSHYCLMMHPEMELYQLEHIVHEWQDSLTLLICCDEFVSEMKITNASRIIHYDMPNSKTKFSNRLACMRQFFFDFSDPEKKRVVEPTSHIIITENCQYSELLHIYEMLQRTSSPVPSRLQEILQGRKDEWNRDVDRELCDQILAYGFCRDKWRCHGRHIVIPEIDVSHYSNWLPDEGEVEVLVSHVVDASHYYVSLRSVRPENGSPQDLSPNFSRLQMDIAFWYSNLDNQKRKTAPFAGEICGYQENEMFYRVQILEFLDMNNRREKGSASIEALVKFVDTGRVEEVPAYKLYELPEHLKTVPFQAVEVFLCKLRPMDRDTEWTRNASRFIHDLIHGKTLEGKIVLRLGYRLWLDPLVKRVHLGESRTTINKFYVNTELIHNGLAIENENHLKWLYHLCDGKVTIPRALLIKTKMSQVLQTDVLPACRQHHEVRVSSVGSSDFFFVQRSEKVDELEELMANIGEYVERLDDGMEPPDIAVGAYCLAEYTSWDKSWYRGQILQVEEDFYEVFFADYGDKDSVAKNRVRVFPKDRFFELPLQAIECQLAHINPPGPEYKKRAGDIVWDLSHFVNNDLKEMNATVTNKVKSKFAGQHKFVVELHTKTDSEDLDIASEVLWRQLALPEENGPIEHLFSRPLGVRRISSCLLIPDLCAAIYWEQEPSKALSAAEEISTIIQRSVWGLTSEQGKKSACEGLQCLVKLVGRTGWGNVHSVLLECLVSLVKAEKRFVEYMLTAGLISSVIRCLEMNSDSILQHQAADFIAKVSNISNVLRAYFQPLENLFVLYELFDYTQCEQVQGSVCKAFTALCSGSERVPQYLMEKSICVALVKCLNQSTDHSVTEAMILLISTLSDLHSSHADLKRETLIEAIVKNLRKTACDKCIQHSIQLLDNFKVTRRKHKTFLLELEVVPVLTRLLALELQSTTKQLCKDLRSSLIVTVPSEPLSGLMLRPNSRETYPTSNSGIPPPVYWSQNSFNVILSVKLSNVPHKENTVTFGKDAVKFSATVEGVIYTFDYKLYGKIMEANSKVAVRSQEVLISMKKEMKERWPRLLFDKQKPANLCVDYERFVDSSCESEVNDEEKPFTLKRKKKKVLLGKGPSKPRDKSDEQREASSDSTDTDDSLEQLRDLDDRDYDPFQM